MSSQPKIAFVWDWEPEYEQAVTWKDGLAKALTTMDATVFTDCEQTIRHPYFDIHPVGQLEASQFDAILVWGDFTRPHIESLVKTGLPVAICFAGGETNHPNRDLFDHIFVENESYLKYFEGYSVSVAFGTNDEIFRPQNLSKNFDLYFPATYALWKRHSLIAPLAEAFRVITTGYMYPDSHEKECYEVMERHGATVLPHVSAEAVSRLMNHSRFVVIPSQDNGGSQRTVLEAMACNVPVITMKDSEKTTEYIGGSGAVVEPERDEIVRAMVATYTPGRDIVNQKYSHKHYAQKLIEGVSKLC